MLNLCQSENPGISSPASAYDDVPSPEFHTSPRSDIPVLPHNTRAGWSSEDRGNARDDEARRSEDAYAPRQQTSKDGADFGRRPSGSASIRSDSTGTTNAQSATATSGMVIPNKSTIAEEEIEVPYGRDMRESSGTAIDAREGVRELDATDGEPDNWDKRAALGGLNGLNARLRSAQSEDDDMGDVRSDEYDKVSLGRASVTSDRSIGGLKVPSGQTSVTGDEQEKLRRDYEFKIATMQSRITSLERDLEQQELGAQQTACRLEEELEGFRKASPEKNFFFPVAYLSLQRAEEHGSAMRALQRELDELRDLRAREKERETRRAQADEEELQILRDRCERLEEERNSGVGIVSLQFELMIINLTSFWQDNSEIIEQLRADLEGLMTELNDLSRRNDELMTAKDSDLTVIRDLDSQLKEYKRKYEQAKTELRSVKGLKRYYSACIISHFLISDISTFLTGPQDRRSAADGS